MVLQSSGAISFSDIKTEYVITTNPLSFSQIKGWGGTPLTNISLSSFYSKTSTNNAWPPTTIGSGGTWTKDLADTVKVI